ncbi:MAG: S8 family serine peptidase [Alteraurantiacibacter sp.]
MTAVLLALGLATGPAGAQLGLPQIGVPNTGTLPDPLDDLTHRLDEQTARTARDLLRVQRNAIDRFVRRNAQIVEVDKAGQPARRGELLVMDLDDRAEAALLGEGFRVLGRENIAGLDVSVTRLALPASLSLAEAEALAARIAPDAVVAPDNLHFQSGSAPLALLQQGAAVARSEGVAVGMIDGAPASEGGILATRSFAVGAPMPSNHGSAVAFLLRQAGVDQIRVADVYGSDPAGGGSLAIARALGWLVAEDTKVITISLVGPRNALVQRAISAATQRGAVVVAAVGNNGPAAPPAYPASYPGVVAVTGVDRRNRALLEAGRALHLDYAAPGADLYATDLRGRRVRLRGTSYATPLVAARIAAALGRAGNWRRTLDGEALDLGAPGDDLQFGRGLVCGTCGRS